MLTPTRRPRGDENLGTRLGRGDDNTDLLGRRITKQNKAAKAAAGGGSIVAVSRVQWAETRANGPDGAGTSVLALSSATFSKPEAYSDLPDVNFTAGDELALTDAAYYAVRLRLSIGWSSGSQPTRVALSLLTNNARSGLMVYRWDATPTLGMGFNIDGRDSTVPGAILNPVTEPFYAPGFANDSSNSVCQPVVAWNNGSVSFNSSGSSSSQVVMDVVQYG